MCITTTNVNSSLCAVAYSAFILTLARTAQNDNDTRLIYTCMSADTKNIILFCYMYMCVYRTNLDRCSYNNAFYFEIYTDICSPSDLDEIRKRTHTHAWGMEQSLFFCLKKKNKKLWPLNKYTNVIVINATSSKLPLVLYSDIFCFRKINRLKKLFETIAVFCAESVVFYRMPRTCV